MNQILTNLVIVAFCVWLSAGCATRNPAPVNPFGKYDSEVIKAIEKNWDDILDKQKFSMDRLGKVTVKFRLHPNGTVSDLKILDNDVGEVLGDDCAEAVYQAEPFKPWPQDMVRMTGKDYREITFTFKFR